MNRHHSMCVVSFGGQRCTCGAVFGTIRAAEADPLREAVAEARAARASKTKRDALAALRSASGGEPATPPPPPRGPRG